MLSNTPASWLNCRQEYATIAGMIVTQYGRPVPLPVPSGELDDRGSHVSSALDQLRGYYGLGSASPSGPGPDYFRGATLISCHHLSARATAIKYVPHLLWAITISKCGTACHHVASYMANLWSCCVAYSLSQLQLQTVALKNG